MSAAWPVALAACALAATVGLSACQSTQGRSAELEKESKTLLLDAEGLSIDKESKDVKVLASEIVSSPEGAAVVVEVHNDSSLNLTDVPVLIDVRDKKGRSVYRNDVPGLEQALTAIPYVPANGDAEWVNDQILASGEPASVKVKIGASTSSFAGELPDIEVTEPTLKGDPVSGIEATGDVVNNTGEEQNRLLLYIVARRGDEVVAAGRGAIEHLKDETKPVRYTVFFIGDPKGAELSLSEFPPLPDTAIGGGLENG
ncbi:MAG TPA: hypothetical protein VIT85_00995 [Solirubrobacterales bacterium]